MGISAWYMLKGRHLAMAQRSFRLASIFGVISIFAVITLGDALGYLDAKVQPGKLAAMEAIWGNGGGAGGLQSDRVSQPGRKKKSIRAQDSLCIDPSGHPYADRQAARDKGDSGGVHGTDQKRNPCPGGPQNPEAAPLATLRPCSNSSAIKRTWATPCCSSASHRTRTYPRPRRTISNRPPWIRCPMSPVIFWDLPLDGWRRLCDAHAAHSVRLLLVAEPGAGEALAATRRRFG